MSKQEIKERAVEEQRVASYDLPKMITFYRLAKADGGQPGVHAKIASNRSKIANFCFAGLCPAPRRGAAPDPAGASPQTPKVTLHPTPHTPPLTAA